MKRFFFFAVCLLSALSILSCTPEERAELIESLNGKSSSVASGPIVTVGADYVSAISAVLKGEMNLGRLRRISFRRAGISQADTVPAA